MSLVNFSDPATAQQMLDKITNTAKALGKVRLMEVCGTHTMEIGRLGLRSMLPKNVELISGPGCPVCVTPGSVIDAAADMARAQRARVVTYGDMVRVPGNRTSLDEVKSQGGRVDVVTSPLQALEIAKAIPQEQIVFLTVGFETTTPASAKAIINAKRDGLKNLSFFVSHKIVPPALSALISDQTLGISGFLLPGHVSAIIGQKPYQFIANEGIPGVITGFEPLDILSGILMLCDMLYHTKAAILNAYTRIARPEGNPLAQKTVYSVFETVDAQWRGIGSLPMSGLALKKEFKKFDAVEKFEIVLESAADMPRACACGDVLKGRIRPAECPLFATACTPENPVGPCMVSSEGSCAASFKYGAQ